MANVNTYLDTPWKNILDIYFQHFMEICYPEVAIDWSKGYEALDKELNAISRVSEVLSYWIMRRSEIF